jgi:hypothetical protein
MNIIKSHTFNHLRLNEGAEVSTVTSKVFNGMFRLGDTAGSEDTTDLTTVDAY